MKKVILLAAVAFGVMSSANAQVSLQGSKLTDNISVTLKGGVATPFNVDEFGGVVVGLEARKQITPIFGIGVEGTWNLEGDYMMNVDHKQAHTYAFDRSYVGMFGAVNMMNLIKGYTGAPRKFEVEAVFGTGWLHAYVPEWWGSKRNYQGYDKDSFGVKVGANLNYNFGSKSQWTASLKPAIVWDADDLFAPIDAQMCSSHANWELTAGITYHFKNSNGTHHFTIVKPYDQAEVDALNAQINELRAANEACNAGAAALKAANEKLAAELEACKNKPVVVQEVVKVDQKATLNTVRYVYFRKGASTIAADQKPNVEMIASYLKSHPKAKVSVKGYASPEGSKEVNEKLANARANAVKDMLVKTYKIAADRINAEGQGIGNMFEEASWNRVSICTLEEAK